MTLPIFRALPAELTTDGKNLYGMAFHWDTPSNVTDDGSTFYLEQFSRSSVTKTLKERAAVPLPLGVKHPWMLPDSEAEPVGSVRFRALDEGLAFHARVSDAATLEQVRSGELADVSIGFVPYKSTEADGIVTRTEIGLLELSLAAPGTAQHQGAQVMAIRAVEPSKARLRVSQRKASLELWLPQ